MYNDFLKKAITSQAEFVQANGWGYGQVEPNHIASQASKETYAQLPANKDIKILEQGQFVKYDYLKGEVNFEGKGEWMLVYNEIKLYRDHQSDCEFAMIKDNYQARVYSPFGYELGDNTNQIAGDFSEPAMRQSRYYNGVDADGNDSIELGGKTYAYDDVTAAEDIYEIHYNEDPFHIYAPYKPAMMPTGTSMVPRVLKTAIGDIFTTNTIGEESVELGDELSPRAEDGILSKSGDGSMTWQVVKIYTMPDHQPGVKVMRIA